MALPRIEAFEFNDSPWVPAPLRDLIVESLSRHLDWGGALAGVAGPFAQFLHAAGTPEVLDLCSGAGGPARILVQELARAGARPPRFLLTDLNPQITAWEDLRMRFPDSIDYIHAPVDATCIPPVISRGRARVLINAFHHFPPAIARWVLADAVRSSEGIFLAEVLERSVTSFATFAALGPAALLLTPLLTRRHRLAKALLAWGTPAAWATAVWDGVVSSLRTYNEQELRSLVSPLGSSFHWHHGTFAYWPGGRGSYFYGVRRHRGRRRAGPHSLHRPDHEQLASAKTS